MNDFRLEIHPVPGQGGMNELTEQLQETILE